MVDKYANIATSAVTQSAANTLTFAEIPTGLGIEPDRKSARAMLIDQIDYLIPSSMLGAMTATADQVQYALLISNAPTSITDITDRRILHSGSLLRHDMGTSATAVIFRSPVSHQFFPPLITAERSLYLALGSVGLAAAYTLRARIYYRTVEITQADFIELAEVFQMVG